MSDDEDLAELVRRVRRMEDEISDLRERVRRIERKTDTSPAQRGSPGKAARGPASRGVTRIPLRWLPA